ncbi:hypothetical protein J6590_024600 [Homalodisca vitripennis]|nr:hypothetical protein J6590_024600 [Homalodisca vitripennis]
MFDTGRSYQRELLTEMTRRSRLSVISFGNGRAQSSRFYTEEEQDQDSESAEPAMTHAPCRPDLVNIVTATANGLGPRG